MSEQPNENAPGEHEAQCRQYADGLLMRSSALRLNSDRVTDTADTHVPHTGLPQHLQNALQRTMLHAAHASNALADELEDNAAAIHQHLADHREHPN